MKLSEHLMNVKAFIDEHGDVEISAEYWCESCEDYHEGNGVKLDLASDGKAVLSTIRLGED